MKQNNILAVIPARAGSKGVPNKNIRKIAGKPLIYYTIKEGLKSKLITHLVVTSDSQKIIKISEFFGAKTILRPKNLALDNTQMVPVLKHAINMMEKKNKIQYDYIILLQPTSPLRTVKDIDNSLKILINKKPDSVISLCRLYDHHPARIKKIINNKIMDFCLKEKDIGRQKLFPPAYIRNGAIYAMKRDLIMKKNTIKGGISRPYIMSEKNSVNIDNELDFKLAELIISQKL